MQKPPQIADSPLARIKNLEAVDPAKVAALESRLKHNYVAGMTEYLREARLQAEKVRDKVLY